MAVERVASGVPGMDDILGGGFLPGSVNLVTGATGAGKTLLATQFIYNGVYEHGDPGILITLEEGATNIWWNMESFSWNLTKFQRQGLLDIYRIGKIENNCLVLDVDKEIKKLAERIEEMKAKRVAFDSLSSLAFYIDDEHELKRTIYKLGNALKNSGATCVLTSEMPPTADKFSRFGVEEIVADSVILLSFSPPFRYVLVRKQRGSSHSVNFHPFEIAENGIVVNPEENIPIEKTRR